MNSSETCAVVIFSRNVSIYSLYFCPFQGQSISTWHWFLSVDSPTVCLAPFCGQSDTSLVSGALLCIMCFTDTGVFMAPLAVGDQQSKGTHQIGLISGVPSIQAYFTDASILLSSWANFFWNYGSFPRVGKRMQLMPLALWEVPPPQTQSVRVSKISPDFHFTFQILESDSFQMILSNDSDRGPSSMSRK